MIRALGADLAYADPQPAFRDGCGVSGRAAVRVFLSGGSKMP